MYIYFHFIFKIEITKINMGGKNLTFIFETLCQESRNNNYINFPKNAKKYTYFLIPGLFTNNYGSKYMEDNISHLQKLGLNVQKLWINTGSNIETNSEVIRDSIIKEGKNNKIVIIGHSKGGVDAATAIAKYKLYEYIQALVLVQSPWLGTPIAEEAETNPFISTMINIAAYIFNADKKAVLDLKYGEREKLIQKYHLDVNKIKIICLSSTIEKKSSLLLPMIGYLNVKYGLKNDGIVCEKDSIIPGSDFIKLKELDHFETVFLLGGRNFFNSQIYPGDIMYALVVLSLI